MEGLVFPMEKNEHACFGSFFKYTSISWIINYLLLSIQGAYIILFLLFDIYGISLRQGERFKIFLLLFDNWKTEALRKGTIQCLLESNRRANHLLSGQSCPLFDSEASYARGRTCTFYITSKSAWAPSYLHPLVFSTLPPLCYFYGS